MPDTEDITALAGVQRLRGVIQTVQREPFLVHSLQDEERVRQYMFGLGYRVFGVESRADGWVVNFVNTKTIADTDRGDSVAVDGRYELRDG